jgi:uncharacterized membrane-anchored protein
LTFYYVYDNINTAYPNQLQGEMMSRTHKSTENTDEKQVRRNLRDALVVLLAMVNVSAVGAAFAAEAGDPIRTVVSIALITEAVLVGGICFILWVRSVAHRSS